jgi:predicted cupin superfamily sugar epimerase
MKTAEYWIEALGLEKHPEGGYFVETYRSSESIAQSALAKRYNRERTASTAIYFLLKSEDRSHFHRLRSDEIWHFYSGSTAKLWIISPQGEATEHLVGSGLERGEKFQTIIPHGHWFAAEVLEPNSYVLVGCTVAPGFEFEDFQLAKKDELLKMFPQHEALITRFTPQ